VLDAAVAAFGRAMEPSKKPLLMVSKGQLDSCWQMGAGGLRSLALGLTSGATMSSLKEEIF
jgi:hypothetical protein